MTNERHSSTWEVDLQVIGPITVASPIRSSQVKSLRLTDPFYSDIHIAKASQGVRITATARAASQNLARKAALIFIGHMLDVLTLEIDEPLYLSLTGRWPVQGESFATRRIVHQHEWQAAFDGAHLLAMKESTFLRALGWYRKGLYTEDSFDRFLALWNAIEIVACKYHPPIPNERPQGSKSKIWECFKAVWGDCDSWPVVPGQKRWIDDSHETRNFIAHGVHPVRVSEVETVLSQLDAVRQVAWRFLHDWRKLKMPLAES